MSHSTTLPEKTSAEIIVVDFDFSAELSASETVVAKSIVVATADGCDADPSAIIGSSTLTTPHVYLQLRAGVNGTDYTVRCTATTSGSKVLVRKALLQIRD